ncbi:MAG TPA: two-component regulator propeller domain-containing protein [Ignavibacteriaceae bacterium]|nr:two-component regulator propeller domain-containing protein [Ignavibacteriaceae bacterium]
MQHLFNKNLFFQFCLIITICFASNIRAQSIPFNRLTTNDGLSNNYVYDLLQDRLGFLWFATDDGLNRFDGYEFKVFRNDPNDKNSISDNSVWTLTEDQSGKIWMGTKNGFVNCYDPVLDRFTYWQIKSDITKENPITTIYIDSKDSIWIGTYRSGVYKLNPATGKTTRWYHNPNDSTTISNNYISSILEDDFGNIWIGTFNGLNNLNPKKSLTNFTHYFYDKANNNSLSDNLIWAITKSHLNKNTFWIGTASGLTKLNTQTESFTQVKILNPDNLQFGISTAFVLEEVVNGDEIIWTNSYAGLIRHNITKNVFNRFLYDKNDPHSLVSNQINNILKDRSGVLWIATHNGLCYFSDKTIKFNNAQPFLNDYFNPGELNKLNIKAIAQTKDGALWFGTDNGLFKSYDSDKNIKLTSENIWALVSGHSNDLWIGTYGYGLFNYNYRSGRISRVNVIDDLIKSTSKNFIKSLLLDNKNNLWIGYWGVGLARLNTITNQTDYWHHETNDQYSLSHDDVWVIYQDSKNRIWIGTNGGGLNLYSESNNQSFTHFNFIDNNKNSLSSNSIYSIAESKQKNNTNENTTILWVGTNNGLNKLVINNLKSDFNSLLAEIKITHYTNKDGLADNSIKSIVEDENGNLWLGTSSGITFFDLQKNTFTNYSNADGVIGNDFNFLSALKLNNNLIFMGSTTGLNYFSSNKIQRSNYQPHVVVTDFQIFNKSVSVNNKNIIHKNILYADEIALAHTDNVFSFQFSALDFNNSSSIKYAYQMEGFDKDWIQSGTRRFVTYTNLNPGKYVFKVKSTNSDGVWCDNTAFINVTISPPWWQTGWAILLYFAVFVFGIWAIIKFQANRAKLQHELKYRELESYHFREIEKMKSRFFANLSHEFRTPLMLIKGPLEELISGRIKENKSQYYNLLLRNTEKLQQLIDQLLELSQLEAESIPLKAETEDLVKLLKNFSASFTSLAELNNIKFNFNSSVDFAPALVDKDKFEKIINNLLSNAFKFTPVGGVITIDLSIEKKEEIDFAKISITDSGIGIPKELQSKIFDRFYQVEDVSKRVAGGSGIGLALVKELVLLHKWEISVNSSEGKGTEFLLTIPLQTEIQSKHLEKQKENLNETLFENSSELNDELDLEEKDVEKQNEKPLILFVEDTADVRNYLNDILKEDYNILLAENGEVGLEIIQHSLPDLIISDVMMPGMDGIEFCKKIKTDWRTSHIPVILLTAKATQQSKIEGLETGADDYMTKPFNFTELSIRIKNLISQRRQLKERFSKEIIVTAETLTTNSIDKELIQKINTAIEKNLSNENFTSDNLAEELFVSRSQLNRKLNAIANQGPGEFIRNYKLKRAAQMIVENKLSITQIAYEVGFGSPAQFTRAFQKYFKCLPSEFKQIKP